MNATQPEESKRERIGRLCIIAAIFGFSIVLVVLLPVAVFGAWFWSGDLQGSKSSAEHWAGFWSLLVWTFIHRMLYVLIPSGLLLWYGRRYRRKVGREGAA